MRIQQTNLPKVPELNKEVNTEFSSDRTAAKQNQKDVFETATTAQQQASIYKLEKSKVETAIENVEGLTPPVMGTPISSYLSIRKNDRTDLLKEATEDLGNSNDLSQEEAIALQKRLAELTKAATTKSNTTTKIAKGLDSIIGNIRG